MYHQSQRDDLNIYLWVIFFYNWSEIYGSCQLSMGDYLMQFLLMVEIDGYKKQILV